MVVMIASRPVIKDHDEPFLFALYMSSRQLEMHSWGWSEKEKLDFLRMQYDCRHRSYQMRYPLMESRIITYFSIPVGRIIIAKKEKAMVLLDITLLPEYQNQGIGTALLKEMQQNIKREEILQLTVLKSNSAARKLYEKLGFRGNGEDELYLVMEWKAEHWISVPTYDKGVT